MRGAASPGSAVSRADLFPRVSCQRTPHPFAPLPPPGRNLDWNPDLGLNKYKTIIVFKPDDAHAHATVGYAPLWGAITGMSAMGLTVHEANLEENRITFEGVPWLLRLRMVMEQADNLQVGGGQASRARAREAGERVHAQGACDGANWLQFRAHTAIAQSPNRPPRRPP